MNIYTIIFKELIKRKTQFLTSLIAITIGITIIVAIRSITISSEVAIGIELDRLGANILILPQNASVDSYYTADVNAQEIPQEYVDRLTSSKIPGIDNMSPKLAQRVNQGDKSYVLTGILPKNEVASKSIWNISVANDPELSAACDPNQIISKNKTTEPKLIVEELKENECLIGYDAALLFNLKQGDPFQIRDRKFTVKQIIRQTGTIDDSRIFVHLNVAQSVLGKGKVINSIEIMGCCSRISEGLLGKIRNVLPDTKVVSINHIVKTQLETNQSMKSFSTIFLIIIIFVGGVSIGNYMWGNVQERKREIGILSAIGFKPVMIYKIFLYKALILGILGGIIGYLFGMITGLILGPIFADVTILFDIFLLIWTLVIAVLVSLIASFFPAKKAANIDVAIVLQEV